MNPTRTFLDWQQPIAPLLANHLIPSTNNRKPLDLSNRLIIVPTRQAGRRLKRALIERAPLLNPRIEPPNALLQNPPTLHNIANPFEILGAWCNVLQQINLTAFPTLFPIAPPKQNIAWALPTAKALQALRATLAESGQRISNINATDLPETERWDDLKRLETLYIAQLRDLQKYDPHAQLIKQSHDPLIPKNTQEIILAACPDINPIALRALENLSHTIPVTILIHAPQNLADHFDPLGRPLSDAWKQYNINLPEHGKHLFLEATPQDQAKRVLQIINQQCTHLTSGDIALGVPDETIIPTLSRQMETKGITSYNPGGQPLTQHPTTQLLLNIIHMRLENSFESLALLLHHPDILHLLNQDHSLLERLDLLQQKHLPRKALDGIHTLQLNTLKPWLTLPVSNLLNLLQKILHNQQLQPDDPQEADSIAVIEQLREAIHAATTCTLPGLSEEHRFKLLEDHLRTQTYYPGRGQSLIDLEGWLELHWNPSPLLILTGMNEGYVPQSQTSDTFLPESARQALQLRTDEERYARDAYILAAMIASRKKHGHLSCIAGKTNTSGDLLKPSRLLLHCKNHQLVQRAQTLFASTQSHEEPAPYSQTLRFSPEPGIKITHLSVTAFKDYLACPFRFYLKHALKMQKKDFSKKEMDPMDFGIGIHYALEQIGRDPTLRELDDPIKLAAILQDFAQEWLQKKFGNNRALHLQIQQNVMNSRLTQAAKIHTTELKKGWRIIDTELKLNTQLQGITLSGKIDRIDRHQNSGAIRIIDYKTSDTLTPPETAHLKNKKWIDLQLPLYAHIYDPNATLAYFQLPKATSDTALQTWENFGPQQLNQAIAKAQDIIKNIQADIFWPPTEKMKYDDFEELFYAGVEKSLTPETLTAFQNNTHT